MSTAELQSQRVPGTALLTVVFPLSISELHEGDKNLSCNFFFLSRGSDL